MASYPHTYLVHATGTPSGAVPVFADGLQTLPTAPPREFGGPGDLWSPETLLAAAVVDCFILTFRAIARAARLEWVSLECRIEAVLEPLEGVAQFTQFTTHARLVVAAGVDPGRAERLLEKAEHGCLIANSLRGARALETTITVAPEAASA
jgi:organic hydroperoxide reductase OsmC/OhrA